MSATVLDLRRFLEFLGDDEPVFVDAAGRLCVGNGIEWAIQRFDPAATTAESED